MKKSSKELAALIIGSKPRPLMDRTEKFGSGMHGYDDDAEAGEDLQLLAGEIFDAVKSDDEEAFSDSLHTFVQTCLDGR